MSHATMAIVIRPAESDDIPAIIAFIKAARAVMFPMLDKESHDQQAELELSKFQKTYLDHPHGAFLTARVNNQLIATIGYLPYDDQFPELDLGRQGIVEIVRLYVDPAWRRAGLASKLVAVAEQTAKNAGIQQIYLHTHPFLDGAVTFWEQQGFSVLQVDDDPLWRTTHMKKLISI
ncbi:acetyltransferase [Colletotrichum karsti]|uniref:Acetyltransferase n=1 Tax=Colletotrichum karsti TaxID=1095194 RepID=A0A9P6I549_9PEZI|nr:acetyltransferase [Colletotrichum karsti]KAF9874176.1 acetyltransferase [Colletotrichum karsti]